jgi:hypothetical protein
MDIKHKHMGRAAALYASLAAIITDLDNIRTEAGQILVDRGDLLTKVNQVIDDEDAFRTAYDAIATREQYFSLGSPEAPDVNQVVTSTDFPVAGGTGSIAANPDVPRNITVGCSTVGGGGVSAVLRVVGVDQFGNAISEDFGVFGAGVAFQALAGSLVFRGIDSVTAISVMVDSGVGNSYDVGTGTKIGIPVQVTASATDVVRVTFGGVAASLTDTAASREAAVDPATHAITIEETLDGSELGVVTARPASGAKTATDIAAPTASAAAKTAVRGEAAGTDPILRV